MLLSSNQTNWSKYNGNKSKGAVYKTALLRLKILTWHFVKICSVNTSLTDNFDFVAVHIEMIRRYLLYLCFSSHVITPVVNSSMYSQVMQRQV